MANFKFIFKALIVGSALLQGAILKAEEKKLKEIRILKPIVHSEEKSVSIPTAKLVAIQTLKPLIPLSWDYVDEPVRNRMIASPSTRPTPVAVIETLKPKFNGIDSVKQPERAIASDLKEPLLVPLPEKYLVAPEEALQPKISVNPQQRLPAQIPFKTVDSRIPQLKKTLPVLAPSQQVFKQRMPIVPPVSPQGLHTPQAPSAKPHSLKELITTPSGLNEPIYDAPINEEMPEIQEN